MLKYTHKSGGKVSKKMKLRKHVVGHFSSRPELTINCLWHWGLVHLKRLK